jgi:2-polyprenyl-3-methyl-5-hydroxy-6-metoxy-1,4-benzoquinol methylase
MEGQGSMGGGSSGSTGRGDAAPTDSAAPIDSSADTGSNSTRSAADLLDVPALARKAYRLAPWSWRFLQTHRDRICPLGVVIERVSPGSTVLDIGCGAGLLVLGLAVTGRASSAVGIDTNARAVAIATEAADSLPEFGVASRERFVFRHVKSAEDWPVGPFDAVTLVDVLHHVPPGDQESMLALAARRVRPGGLLIYKDMRTRPRWRAWANQLHDLLLARQRVHHPPSESVAAWCAGCGLRLIAKASYDRWVYGHEMMVFRKDPP